MNLFTDKGVAVLKEYFTGTVWVNLNVKPDEGYNVNIGTVTFEPTARTNWHSHTSGQILFVIEGIGYYQEKGKPVHYPLPSQESPFTALQNPPMSL